MNEEKTDRHIIVKVSAHWYCMPLYCAPENIGVLPEGATVEMLRKAINVNPENFKAFLLYKLLPFKWGKQREEE